MARLKKSSTKASPKRKSLPLASETFWNAVIGFGSSTAVDCEHCGRTHFAVPGESYEKGELENLEAKAKRNPRNYVRITDSDSISYGYMDGKQTVYGCPCKAAARYEQFIWNNRHVIAKYLAGRSEEQVRKAHADKDLASKVIEAVEESA